VWVVQEGRAAPRAVAVASQQGEEVVIASGVTAGERVMVEGPVDLNEGARIEELKS
jgi:hypothetical protein